MVATTDIFISLFLS